MDNPKLRDESTYHLLRFLMNAAYLIPWNRELKISLDFRALVSTAIRSSFPSHLITLGFTLFSRTLIILSAKFLGLGYVPLQGAWPEADFFFVGMLETPLLLLLPVPSSVNFFNRLAGGCESGCKTVQTMMTLDG